MWVNNRPGVASAAPWGARTCRWGSCPLLRRGPFRSAQSVSFRSVGSVQLGPFRPPRHRALSCPVLPLRGPASASDIHTLPSLHLTSFALHRSRSLSCTSGIFQAPGSLSSLLLVFSLLAGTLPSRLRTPWRRCAAVFVVPTCSGGMFPFRFDRWRGARRW